MRLTPIPSISTVDWWDSGLTPVSHCLPIVKPFRGATAQIWPGPRVISALPPNIGGPPQAHPSCQEARKRPKSIFHFCNEIALSFYLRWGVWVSSSTKGIVKEK